MTATFALAFTQGVSEAVEHSNVLVDSFGIIAMVTMMPIISMLVLGLIYQAKLKKESR
jgi:NADH:ubiquinone oxidoreductase subunit 3 (subunit A)